MVKFLVEFPPLVLVQGAVEKDGAPFLADCRRVRPYVACLGVVLHLRGRGSP